MRKLLRLPSLGLDSRCVVLVSSVMSLDALMKDPSVSLCGYCAAILLCPETTCIYEPVCYFK